MQAGHNLALADGHPLNSDAYFAAVEKVVGVNQQNNGGQQPRREVPNAAPARQTGAYRDGGQRANGGAVPAAFVDHCINVFGFKNAKDGKPDMVAINNAWKDNNEMDRLGQFKNGNPWAGAR